MGELSLLLDAGDGGDSSARGFNGIEAKFIKYNQISLPILVHVNEVDTFDTSVRRAVPLKGTSRFWVIIRIWPAYFSFDVYYYNCCY